MIGGMTRRGLPHLCGVPHHHVNSASVYSSGRLFNCAAHKSKQHDSARAAHVFVHFFVFTARLQREIPSRFYGRRKHATTIFSFSL